MTARTSRQAAASIAPDAHNMRMRILSHIKNTKTGATCDECEEALDMRHQTASARIRELSASGKIKDSGKVRPTRSGRNAIVWRAV